MRGRSNRIAPDLRKVLWISITPVYMPAPGGGAVQADTVARALAAEGDDVLVISEAHPGEPDEALIWTSGSGGEVRIRRSFPFRAGKVRKDAFSYLAYGAANLRYLQLPEIVRQAVAGGEYRCAVAIIHTSLLCKPSVMPWIIPRIRRALGPGGVLVAEAHDHFLAVRQLPALEMSDAIVASSEGVYEDLLRKFPRLADRMSLVTMPFVPPPRPTDEEVARVLDRFGLTGKKFLLNPNGLTSWKHVSEMHRAVSILRSSPDFSDLVLVTVGRERDRTNETDEAEARGEALYLGAVGRTEILGLMRAATMTLVLSRREAISRAALEAASVGGQVLLPDIAEYRAHCPEHVCADTSPAAIARKVEQLACAEPPRFPIDLLAPSAFVPGYRSVLAASREAIR